MPSSPLPGPAIAYIGLGANLDDPVSQIRNARDELAAVSGVDEIAFSSLYRSMPLGPSDQPEYVNAVMAVTTAIRPLPLLRLLQDIENRHGRVRNGDRWGPRTLDLDLLLYGSEKISTDELLVPHPGIAAREFVLIPLIEIAPNLLVPGQGPVTDLLRSCPRATVPLTMIDDERT